MASKGRRPAGLPKTSALNPPDWTPEDAYAVQALMRGLASEDQQLRGMRFIVEQLCANYDWAFRPDPRETDVMLGRQFVGKQLVKFANLNIAKVLKRAPTEQGGAPAPQE